MPMHDWTRVSGGTFHDFHLAWIAELRKSLNGGVLPKGYYAQAEPYAGGRIPDVLGLHESDPLTDSAPVPSGGGVATMTKTRPKVDERLVATPTPVKGKSRSLSVRSTAGHRIVAFIEIVSPANRDRFESVVSFVQKIVGALRSGVHVLLIDPFPPGPSDPNGLHGAVWHAVSSEHDELPPDRPLTLSAYTAGAEIGGFVTRLAIGSPLPDMPLFLTPKKYVPVPLADTYAEAYAGMPEFWRDVIEKKPA